MTTKKRKPTVARGAVIERSLVKRYLQRGYDAIVMSTHQGTAYDTGRADAYMDAIAWLDRQRIRTKRKGGIGR